MLGRTHATIGLAAGAALAVELKADIPTVGVMCLLGAVGGLLADIDTPHSLISNQVWPARLLLFWVKHRGVTHSLILLGIVTVLAQKYLGFYGLALGAGYASHLLGDMATREGVPLLWPYGRRLHILPPGLRLTTGGLMESLVWLATVGLLGWLALQLALGEIPLLLR